MSSVLSRINLHLKIKKYLIASSYFFIIFGVLIFIFYAISNSNNKFKLVADYKNNPEKFKTEKIMVNPRIKFQYNDQQVYEIVAKRAMHKDEQEVTLYDVHATGAIGNITSGELKIDESGDHLVFTKNPVLILNNTNKK